MDISYSLGVDSSAAEKALAGLSRKIDGVFSALKKPSAINVDTALSRKSINQLADSFTKSQTAAQGSITAQRGALAQMAAEGKSGTSEFKNLVGQLKVSQKESEKLENALKQVDNTTSKLSLGEKLKQQLGGENLLASFGGNLLAGGVTAGISAITGGFSAAIEIGKQFETSLAAVSAITGASGAQLDALGSSARELAIKFGTSATDQLASFEGLLSRFGPAIGNSPAALNSMTDTINIFSKAAGIDAATSMDVLTNSALQFGVDLSNPTTAAAELAKMMNVMAAASKEGAANIPGVGEAIVAAGTAAKLAKISFEETNAAIQITGAKAGKYGSEAGSGIRNVIGLLQKNSEEAKKAAASIGVDFDKLGKTLTEKGLSAAMQDIKKGLDGVGSTAEKNAVLMQIFGTENTSVAAAIINNTGEMDKFKKAISGTQVGYEQAAINMATFEEASKRAKAKLEDLGISFFQTIKPGLAIVAQGFSALIDILSVAGTVIGSIIGKVASFSDGVVKFAKNNQDIVIPVLGALATILSFTLLPSILATVTGYASSAVAAVAAGAASVGAAIAAGAAWLVANAPLVALGVAVGGVIFVFKKLYDNFEPFRNIVDSVVGFAVKKFEQMSAFVGKIVSELGEFFGIKPKPIKIETKIDTPVIPKPAPPPAVEGKIIPKVDEKAAKKANDDRVKAEKELQEQLAKLRVESIADAKEKELAAIRKTYGDDVKAVEEKEKITGTKQTEIRTILLNQLKSKEKEINAKFEKEETERHAKFLKENLSTELLFAKTAQDAITEKGIAGDIKRSEKQFGILDAQLKLDLNNIQITDDEKARIEKASAEERAGIQESIDRRTSIQRAAILTKYTNDRIELEKGLSENQARFKIGQIEDSALREKETTLFELKRTFDEKFKAANGNRSLEIIAEKEYAKKKSEIELDFLAKTNTFYKASLDFKAAMMEGFKNRVTDEGKKKRDETLSGLKKEEDDLEKSFKNKEISFKQYTAKIGDIGRKRKDADIQDESVKDRAVRGLQQGALASLQGTQNILSKLGGESVSTFLSDAKSYISSFKGIGQEGLNALMTSGQNALSVIAQQAKDGSVTWESAGKAALSASLDFLQAMVPIWSAQVLGASLASPLSIMTAGAAGFTQWAITVAIIQAAVSGVRALIGFENGGFTGYGRTNEVAGLVHGQEFVNKATTTRRERPLLEFMHKGGTSDQYFVNKHGALIKSIVNSSVTEKLATMDMYKSVRGEMTAVARATERQTAIMQENFMTLTNETRALQNTVQQSVNVGLVIKNDPNATLKAMQDKQAYELNI